MKLTVWACFNERFILPPTLFSCKCHCRFLLWFVIITCYSWIGAPAHTARKIVELLQTRFQQRLIGKGTGFTWPPYRPDLAPSDYFLWGYLKSKVYADGAFQDVATLKNRVEEEINQISSEMLANVIRHFVWTTSIMCFEQWLIGSFIFNFCTCFVLFVFPIVWCFDCITIFVQ